MGTSHSEEGTGISTLTNQIRGEMIKEIERGAREIPPMNVDEFYKGANALFLDCINLCESNQME